MNIHKEHSKHWSIMTIHEAHQHFYFTWHKEIFEIRRLMVAIKYFRLFMYIVAASVAILLHLLVHVMHVIKSSNGQLDIIVIPSIVFISIYTILLFRGYTYWYNTAESQYLYVQLCFSLSPNFLKDFSLLNEAHTLQPHKTNFQELYALEKLMVKYENRYLRASPEQF